MSYQFVFNQYYIDLIKRLKTASKEYKESDEMEKIQLGRKVLKAIKEKYVTIDKSSDVYLRHVQNIPSDFWSSYLEIDMENADEWFMKEDVACVQLYDNICVQEIYELMQDKYLCHHFVSVFYVFKDEMSNDQLMTYVKYLQGNDKDVTIDCIENEEHKKVLLRLKEIRIKNIKDSTNVDLKSIEDTTLGKLAKEILEDVDVEKIQKSIGEKGDVLKAIGDPDSGFTELITSVSRKMANKISSGELKQENLLQDAMKFASVMPGLFGGKGGPPKNGPDMSHMMDLMSSMMGNKDGMDMFKNMAAQMKTPKGSRPSFDNSALKKMAAAKKMKAKLHKRKESEASQEATCNEES